MLPKLTVLLLQMSAIGTVPIAAMVSDTDTPKSSVHLEAVSAEGTVPIADRLTDILQIVRGFLIDVVVEPVGVEKVGVSAPAV